MDFTQFQPQGFPALPPSKKGEIMPYLKTLCAMVGTHQTAYIKFVLTPLCWGLRCDIDVDYDSGWEFTLQVLCFQIWIGA